MSKKPKLLIVEDEKLIIKFYNVFLSLYFKITLIESVEDFNKILDSESVYDAVLMDLHIHGRDFDGIRLSREFRSRKRNNNCPILVVTSSHVQEIEPNIIEEIFNAGISKILEKPIENKLLLEEIFASIKLSVN